MPHEFFTYPRKKFTAERGYKYTPHNIRYFPFIIILQPHIFNTSTTRSQKFFQKHFLQHAGGKNVIEY